MNEAAVVQLFQKISQYLIQTNTGVSLFVEMQTELQKVVQAKQAALAKKKEEEEAVKKKEEEALYTELTTCRHTEEFGDCKGCPSCDCEK